MEAAPEIVAWQQKSQQSTIRLSLSWLFQVVGQCWRPYGHLSPCCLFVNLLWSLAGTLGGSRNEELATTPFIINNQPLDCALMSGHRFANPCDLGGYLCGGPDKIIHAVGEAGCCAIVNCDLERI
jgi:hypothetical protein